MARVRVTFDGSHIQLGAGLLMHNERLQDALDPYAKWVSELSKKTRKTDLDYEEVSRREWLAGGYWKNDDGPGSDPSVPIIPTANIRRCLIEAARKYKLGKTLEQEVYPLSSYSEVKYDGPTKCSELWETRAFHLRKGVAVGGRRVMRTRPLFTDWTIETEFESNMPIEQMRVVAFEAGKNIGMGDYRPWFGRFLGTVEVLEESDSFLIPDSVARAYAELARETGVKKVARDSKKQAATNGSALSGNGRVKAGA